MMRTITMTSLGRPLAVALLGLLSFSGAVAQKRPVSAATSVRQGARAPQAAISSTATGGNWSDATTWVGGVVPTANDEVTIASGATVTLDVNATCGNLTVAGGASLLTSASTAYQLQVAGSLLNNGTLDLSNTTGTATVGSELRFTGAGNASFSGTGTTDLQSLSLGKAAATDVVSLDLPNLAVQGAAGTPSTGTGFLITRAGSPAADYMTGILRLAGTATLTNKVVQSASYIIPATGGIWLSNPNFTVVGQNGSVTNNGLLRVSAGTYTIGSSSGNSLGFGSGAALTVEGGALNVAGRLNAASTAPITFTQSGGTISVLTQAPSTSAFASFGLLSNDPANVQNISGGTIVLVNRNGAVTPGNDYNVLGTMNYTGGTLQVGSGATATNFNFRIGGNVPGLVIDNTTNAKTVALGAPTTIYGPVTINSGTSLDVGVLELTYRGPGITNNGTLTATSGRLAFTGTTAQTLGGTGTFSAVGTLTLNNAAGLTLGTPLTVADNLVLTSGKLATTATNLLTLQTASPPTGSAASYVQGPLAIQINSSSVAARTFAVGDATAWRPIVVSGLTTTGMQTFTATVLSGTPAATRTAPLTVINTTRYARVQGPLPASATVQLSYGSDDVVGNVSSAVVAQAAAPTGPYTSVGGAPTSTPTTGLFSTASLTSGQEYFVLANTQQEGGVLSSSIAGGCPGIGGTLTLTNYSGTIVGYQVDTGAGFQDVAGTTTSPTLTFSNLTQTSTFRAVLRTVDGRTVFSQPVTVTVTPAPVATLTATSATTFCGSGTLTLTAPASTGTVFYQFLRNGQPIAGATAATYTTTVTASASYAVTVSNTSGCSTTSTPVEVTVNPATTAGFSYAASSFCTSGTANPTPTLATGATAGTFSSTTGLVLDAATGTIDLSVSKPGTYTITNSVGGSCPSSATFQVTITAPAAAGFSYASTSFCTSASGAVAPTLATDATAGTFSSTAGLTLNPTTGAITPSTSTPGTYTITNTVAAAGGCAAATATATVTITAPATAGFSYASASFCSGDAATPTPALATGATAGTFSSTTGLTINAATGAITLASSTPGTYTVTNSVAASGGCAAVTATTTVTINATPARPTVTATYSGSTTTLTSSAATGNQWYLNGTAIPGATNSTYVVSAAAQYGTYTVVTTSAQGCASPASQPLVVTTSVKPLAGSSLMIYPNPTSDGRLTLKLQGYSKAVELTVYNSVGQPVRTLTVPAGRLDQPLDLSQLPSGVYLLRARTEGGLDVRRIVKQ
ncbi:T9SS type A sorting domain-containing protein [Hymenobacter sp. HSC-4F20]|uniref:T9SS type A sorting domain-containing protein n=1 Tax=Hymenobacter sp. HSC-4F20 TaxID=2864135 RepID=UPI001C72E99E|nr:T9SS type A sorting domain-containing protein [Hymenobacter sp. HSC-4F20]MBX0292389.1 T9SS type A sorting domain-containing protein [Hymenobacter sp. HSC-4F20]